MKCDKKSVFLFSVYTFPRKKTMASQNIVCYLSSYFKIVCCAFEEKYDIHFIKNKADYNILSQGGD